MTDPFSDIPALAQGLFSGDRRALSKAITLIESRRPTDRPKADELLDRCVQLSPETHRLAITGVPGVGKSTFIEELGLRFIGKGHRVAVLAVDPSSQRNQGSILGDKTRMSRLSIRDEAFIRPSPASDTLGGVARKTRETMLLCEAAGFDRIIIETVGVGQSEVSVRSMVDSFILLMLGGAGDELQGIKRGIMEMADVILINKADGAMLDVARETATDYRAALHLLPGDDSWNVRVALVSALEGVGFEEALELMEEHLAFLEKDGRKSLIRRSQELDWFDELLQQRIIEQFMAQEGMASRIAEYREAVARGLSAPLSAVRQALAED